MKVVKFERISARTSCRRGHVLKEYEQAVR
jgi:hypothetical protein